VPNVAKNTLIVFVPLTTYQSVGGVAGKKINQLTNI